MRPGNPITYSHCLASKSFLQSDVFTIKSIVMKWQGLERGGRQRRGGGEAGSCPPGGAGSEWPKQGTDRWQTDRLGLRGAKSIPTAWSPGSADGNLGFGVPPLAGCREDGVRVLWWSRGCLRDWQEEPRGGAGARERMLPKLPHQERMLPKLPRTLLWGTGTPNPCCDAAPCTG